MDTALATPEWQTFTQRCWQVEPVRFKDRDRAMIEHAEALRVEQIRDRFFGKLRALVPTGRAHA